MSARPYTVWARTKPGDPLTKRFGPSPSWSRCQDTAFIALMVGCHEVEIREYGLVIAIDTQKAAIRRAAEKRRSDPTFAAECERLLAKAGESK